MLHQKAPFQLIAIGLALVVSISAWNPAEPANVSESATNVPVQPTKSVQGNPGDSSTASQKEDSVEKATKLSNDLGKESQISEGSQNHFGDSKIASSKEVAHDKEKTTSEIDADGSTMSTGSDGHPNESNTAAPKEDLLDNATAPAKSDEKKTPASASPEGHPNELTPKKDSPDKAKASSEGNENKDQASASSQGPPSESKSATPKEGNSDKAEPSNNGGKGGRSSAGSDEHPSDSKALSPEEGSLDKEKVKPPSGIEKSSNSLVSGSSPEDDSLVAEAAGYPSYRDEDEVGTMLNPIAICAILAGISVMLVTLFFRCQGLRRSSGFSPLRQTDDIEMGSPDVITTGQTGSPVDLFVLETCTDMGIPAFGAETFRKVFADQGLRQMSQLRRLDNDDWKRLGLPTVVQDMLRDRLDPSVKPSAAESGSRSQGLNLRRKSNSFIDAADLPFRNEPPLNKVSGNVMNGLEDQLDREEDAADDDGFDDWNSDDGWTD